MTAVRVELDDDGVIERAWVPSKSEPGKTYEMARTPGGWQHANAECRGWVEYGRCYHCTALEEVMNEQIEETRAISVQLSPLSLLDAVELDDIMGSKMLPSERHIYSFKVKGQTVEGVSIDGVRDAARALSTKGEAIREQWVRLDREDERDAYFVACAARYAIAPDGREICMDTAIRAKRQPKYLKLREGGEQFNESWYEIGVAKAVRNATEALLPEALKDWIKAKARELRGTAPAENGGNAPQQRQDGACSVCRAPAGKPHGSGCSAAGTVNEAPAATPAKPRATGKAAAPPTNHRPITLQIADALHALPDALMTSLIARINESLGDTVINEHGDTMIGKLDAERWAPVLAFIQRGSAAATGDEAAQGALIQ